MSSIIRNFLNSYRSIQYKIYNRHKFGVINEGKLCHVEDPYYKITQGDIVHPCVRYIRNGFRGHKWWMVYTPYYLSDASIENPRLCWGDDSHSRVPTTWHFESFIQDGHEKGYNSDPFLLYHNNKLLCFWRENSTTKLTDLNLNHGTFYKSYDDNGNWSDIKLLMGEEAEYQDRETCPAITFENGKWIGLGMWLKFKNKGIRKLLPNKGRLIYDKIINILDLIGIYSQQKFKGITIWYGDSLSEPLKHFETQPIIGVNRLYKPWHMDIFEYANSRYMVVQTNQCNADICLAKQMEDGSFKLFPVPLITNKDISKVGIYKPTAGVVNDEFFLYYTAQDIEDRTLNRLYLVTMPFELLLKKLEKQ